MTDRPEEAPVPEGAVLAELADLATRLAREAGELVVRDRPDRLEVATKSSDTDVVTEMDSRSEEFLRDRLARLRPDDAVFGEEAGPGRSGTSGLTWVLDPIDGTVNYLYGSAEYAVSVAVVVGDPTVHGGWEPVAGSVCRPTSDETWSARRGGGAFHHRGDRRTPLRVRDETDLGQVLLGTGFGYRQEVRRAQAEALVRVLPHVRDIRRGGSAALDLCAVASGRLDAYYERGVNAWDIAAGWLVVTEAGGTVSDFAGGRPTPAGTVAAGPGVHDALRDLVGGAFGS